MKYVQTSVQLKLLQYYRRSFQTSFSKPHFQTKKNASSLNPDKSMILQLLLLCGLLVQIVLCRNLKMSDEDVSEIIMVRCGMNKERQIGMFSEEPLKTLCIFSKPICFDTVYSKNRTFETMKEIKSSFFDLFVIEEDKTEKVVFF